MRRNGFLIQGLQLCLLCLLIGCGGSSTDSDTPVVVPTPTPPPQPPSPPVMGNEILPVLAPGEAPVYEGEVMVTVTLTVPDNTPENATIYITGDFENWSGGGDPRYALQPMTDGTYQIILTLDAGSAIQYKFTRGNWSIEEASASGSRVGNRSAGFTDQNIQLTENVPAWIDLSDPNAAPIGDYWNTATLDYSANTDRPVLSLNGPNTLLLSVGQSYTEEGASAQDNQQGDLSADIEIDTTLNTNIPGDYVVTYRVTDQDGNEALPIMRMVRVISDTAPRYSIRAVGDTPSHLGYVEQLPAEYGADPDQSFPVLIYHHGGGGDAATINDTPVNALVNIVNVAGGPASIAAAGRWNSESPLLVLTPQRSVLRSPSIARMHAFVQFALANYRIDPSRVYMAGHSQGGLVSWQYAVNYPDYVAAIVPLAGGFFSGGIPANVCDAAPVAVWAFHSRDDNVISASTGRAAVDALNACPPSQRAMFTLFDGLGHQSHAPVLNLSVMGTALSGDDLFMQNLYEWMMAQRSVVGH